MPNEYIGQLMGGPDDGNMVSATTREIRCEVLYRHWLDGPGSDSSELIVRGIYTWDGEAGCFRWTLGSWS